MDHWYFARNDLAKHYLELFDVGIQSYLAVIAPRRRGKTLFLLKDLAPSALKKGYLPVYASLWQNMDAPHEGILLSLQSAIATIHKKKAFNNLLQADIRKTTLSNELLGKMEIEFSSQPVKATPTDLTLLEQRLEALEKKAKKKTILLMVDEVQHLATSELFSALAHSLRTVLDKRQGRVKAIFTGSSRHYMDLLFNSASSAFYHFVDRAPFPPLEAGYINFLHEKLAKEHNVLVSAKALQSVFANFDHSPYWMMKLVSHLITYRTTLPEAESQTIGLLETSEGLDKLAKQLKPIDKIVFCAIANHIAPYSKPVLEQIGEETHLKGSQSNVQRSISRLCTLQIISAQGRGLYHVEKPGLKRYLIALDGS